jgi:urocanate hydratase
MSANFMLLKQVSREAIYKRHQQGWLLEVTDNLDELVTRIRQARKDRKPVSIGYHGNVVDVW